jgi:polygalacturonase
MKSSMRSNDGCLFPQRLTTLKRFAWHGLVAGLAGMSVFISGCLGGGDDTPATYTRYVEVPIQPITNAPFPVPEFLRPSFSSRTFNVVDYGADITGARKSTEAFAKAVAAAKKDGGGRILVPAGKYLTGPIQITSDNGSCDGIDLHVEKGAEITFSSDFGDYLPAVLTRWEGMDVMNYSPLVYFRGCKGAALTGEGTLIGQGWYWWQWKGNVSTEKVDPANPAQTVTLDSNIDFTAEYAAAVYKRYVRADVSPAVPPAQRFVAALDQSQLPAELTSAVATPKINRYRELLNLPAGMWGFLRPAMVEFHTCKNVLMEGVTVKYGPFWMIHPVYSENVIIRNVTVVSFAEGDVYPYTDKSGVSYPTGKIPVTTIPGVANVKYGSKPANGDGANPDSSKYVLIEDAFFNTSDDVIAIKAGLNEDGWRVNLPSDTIVVRRVKSGNGHGGVTVGSEMSGGVRNVFAYDSDLTGDRALRIKTLPGRGGEIRNIYYEKIRVKSIVQALEVTSNYQSGTVSPSNFLPETKARIPVFDGLHYKDIHGTSCVGGVAADGVTCSPVAAGKTPSAGIYLEGVPANVNKDPARPTAASPIRNVTFENFVIKAADYSWNWGDTAFLGRFPSTTASTPAAPTDKYFLADGAPKTCLDACVSMKNVKIDATAASTATFVSGPSFEVDASGNVVGKGGVFACVLSSGATCP